MARLSLDWEGLTVEARSGACTDAADQRYLRSGQAVTPEEPHPFHFGVRRAEPYRVGDIIERDANEPPSVTALGTAEPCPSCGADSSFGDIYRITVMDGQITSVDPFLDYDRYNRYFMDPVTGAGLD